jgi:hypothetical protein
MQQEDDFNFWLDECRNYGLRVTRDRLIKSLYEFDDFAYQFVMSPDSKTMIVLLEREVFNDHIQTMVETPRAEYTANSTSTQSTNTIDWFLTPVQSGKLSVLQPCHWNPYRIHMNHPGYRGGQLV